MSEYFEMRTLHEGRGDFSDLEDSMRSYDSGGEWGKRGEPNGNIPGITHAHHDAASSTTGSTGSSGSNTSPAAPGGDGLFSGWFQWRRQSTGPNRSPRLNIQRPNSYSSVPSDDSAYIEPFPFEDFEDSDTDSDINEDDYVFENGEDIQEIGLGEGHDFRPAQLMNMVTWCDKCGDLIWGFYKQCLRCSCKYTEDVSVHQGSKYARTMCHFTVKVSIHCRMK